MCGEDGVNAVLLLSAQEDVQTVPWPRACDREGRQGGGPVPPPPPSLSLSDFSVHPAMSLGLKSLGLGVRPWLCCSLGGSPASLGWERAQSRMQVGLPGLLGSRKSFANSRSVSVPAGWGWGMMEE